MRIGVSSRGNTWVSMGPIGWLILGQIILAGYILAGISGSWPVSSLGLR